MKTVLLVRHGETIAGKGVFCGSTNVALSDEGKCQSKEIVQELANRKVQLVVTTGLQRTDYCGKLTKKAGIAHIVDTDLREVDFGSWEGMTWEEIEDANPELAQAWLDYPDTMQFPNGENMVQFHKRIRRAWQRLTMYPENCVAVVGHSGVLGYLLQCIGTRQEPTYMRYGELMELHIKTPTAQ